LEHLVKTQDTLDPSRNNLIHVKLFLEAMRSADLLLALRNKRKNPNSKEADALWDGHWHCLQRANEMLKHAINQGQLLFAFQGTTVLNGGTA
jgi:hypothetical protein